MQRRIRTIGTRILEALAVLALLGSVTLAGSTAQPVGVGVSALSRLDQLPRFKSSVRVASFSSYDRTGGNDDGFSGRYSFIRKEGDTLVLAEMEGPGVIYRIHTPTPTDDPLEFYFDGEAEPRLKLKLRELFNGSRPPFVAPLANFGSGGFYSYVPIPYRKSCKVVLRAPHMNFYQIIYATYPPDTRIETFSPGASILTGGDMERARRLLNMTGRDISAELVAEGTPLQVTNATCALAPGQTVTLFETWRGGRLLGLRLRPAEAFAGPDRGVVLKMFWDDSVEPAVLCPAGDFFGYSWGEPAARSLLVGTDGDTAYAYFPMPFDRSARIELVWEKPEGTPLNVQAEVVYADVPRRQDEGRFYATWRRENPTTKGIPFSFIETAGRGHLVGVTLQAQGMEPNATPFFEGDDEATLDGELTIRGLGSEDFFNGGYYEVPGRWDARASYPLSGCLDHSRSQSRSGGYRLFLSDTYAFRRSLKLTIEHAPAGNDLPTDYVGVSYLYLENPPSTPWTLPNQKARVVHDPKRLVFSPGWALPIYAFSLKNATLTRKTERIGEADFRFLSLCAEGRDVFGPHNVSFLCAIPSAGRYRVTIEAMNGPAQGIVQLFDREQPIGEPADFFAEQRGKCEARPMGVLELKKGLNPVFFKLTGKNAKSSGLGLDLVTLTLEKVL
jgi:hypothetical protein